MEESGVVFPQRGRWAAHSLNSLALQDSNSDFDSLLSGLEPNSTQRKAALHIQECLQTAGEPPEGLDGPTALSAMSASKDLYMEEPKNFAKYSFEKVKVLHSKLSPKSLETVLPPHAAAIVKRASTLIEKPASQVAEEGPCNIKPYWDPALRRSPKALRKLVVALANQGLITFRARVKEKIGIFFVKKKTPDWIRMVIDARRVNAMHHTPPCTRLATPRSYLDLQLEQPTDGQPAAFGIEADVNDCFYNFHAEVVASWFGIDCPLSVAQWVDLGWNRTMLYSDESGAHFTPHDDLVVYSVFRGLCMGWSWALYFAQEAVSHIVAGRVPQPLNEIRDRQAAPCLESQRVITGVYVDNISIIGKTEKETTDMARCVEQAFQQLDIPLTWSAHKPSPVFETVGICLDFHHGIAYNKSSRLWRAFFAGRELLRRKVVSVKLVEIWLGHMTSLFMLAPHGLSCFFHIYKFVALHRGKRATMWKTVRAEIRLALGVMWLTRTNILFKPVHQVDAGDSSSGAFALLTTWATRNDLKEACRWREVWRFRPLPSSLAQAATGGSREEVLNALRALCPEGDEYEKLSDNDIKPAAPFGAGLLGQYADWLVQSSDPSSWLRTSAVRSQLRASSNVPYPGLSAKAQTTKQKRIEVDVPALVIPIQPKLVQHDRYSLLWRKKWRDSDSHINIKEGHVALSSLRRTARVCGLHGHLKLTLSDNLSSLSAFERGRSSSFHLNTLCQRAAAYQFAANLRWRLRHIETDRNPADRDSRFLERNTSHRNLGQAMRANTAKVVMEADPQPSGGEECEAGVSNPTRSSGSSSSRCGNKSQQRGSGMFLEIFSGTGRLSQSIADLGLATGVGIDNMNGPHHDLRRRSTQVLILNWLKTGRISYLHLGTPCTVFSRARHHIRNLERAQERERVGLEMAMFTVECIMTCNRYNIRWSLENPRSSRLFELPFMQHVLQQPGVLHVPLDFCQFGEKYRKPTSIYTNFPDLAILERHCNHRKHDDVLRGSEVVAVNGKKTSQPKTRNAGAYPWQLARLWAQAVSHTIAHATRDTDIARRQLEHELTGRYKEGKAGTKQIQSTAPDFFWINSFKQQVGDPHRFAVFGQHTKKEAKERQQRWNRFTQKAPFDTSRFFAVTTAKTPATSGSTGKGSYSA
eukprot:Skav219591  [mRNA]  locus=scaffold1719:13998:17447:+ [translate_table: standard]